MSSYDGNNTTDTFRFPSTIDFPDMTQADPNPHGSLDSIPNAAMGGFGSGGETFESDGSVTTRWKSDGGDIGSDSSTDGGTP